MARDNVKRYSYRKLHTLWLGIMSNVIVIENGTLWLGIMSNVIVIENDTRYG